MIVVVDTETTSWDPKKAEVIEVGAVGVDTSGLEHTFESLCNPGIDLNGCQDALRISGITMDEVYSAPPIRKVADQFREWLNGLRSTEEVELAGFNSKGYDCLILERKPWKIDRGLWKHDAMLMACDPMGEAGILPYYDRYKKYKWPRLDEAISYYKIKRRGKPHRALSDACATLEILKILMDD